MLVMQNLSDSPARFSFSRVLNPSFIIGGLWFGFWSGVALLHLYLFFRRLLSGEFTGGFDEARLVLALAGAVYCIYGTFKIGNIAKRIERSPRKVLAFALILLLGHLSLSPSAVEKAGEWLLSGDVSPAAVVVLPALLAVTLLAAGAMLMIRRREAARRFRPALRRSVEPRIHPRHSRPSALFQRPPPPLP